MTPRRNSPSGPQHFWLFLFFFFTFFLFTPLFAEQRMDSEDQLTVDRFTARERLKSGYITDGYKAELDALKVQEYRDGPIHPALVPILTDLATFNRYLARYADAESSLKWALAIREKAFGLNDLLVAQSQYQLSSLYLDWGHWEDAEFYAKHAVAILEQNLSHGSMLDAWLPDFRRFIRSLNSKKGPKESSTEETKSLPLWQAYRLMGQIELRLQKNKEALIFFRKSLETERKDPDITPAEHISTLDLMAENDVLLQQPAEAQACLEEALQTTKGNFKERSTEVADNSERLGLFFRSQKQEDKAKPHLDFARDIYRSCVGTYFGYASIPYVQKLAKADETQGRWDEAVDLLQKNLQSVRETYGVEHPRVAVGLLDLAEAQTGLGQAAPAQKNLKEALKIAQIFYRNDYPLVVTIQNQIHQ